jgi:hypothetical protein
VLVVDAVVDDDGRGGRGGRRRHRRSSSSSSSSSDGCAAVTRAFAEITGITRITRRRPSAQVGGEGGGALLAKIGGRGAVLVLRSPHRRAVDVAHSGRGAFVASDADADVVLGVVEAHGCGTEDKTQKKSLVCSLARSLAQATKTKSTSRRKANAERKVEEGGGVKGKAEMARLHTAAKRGQTSYPPVFIPRAAQLLLHRVPNSGAKQVQVPLRRICCMCCD